MLDALFQTLANRVASIRGEDPDGLVGRAGQTARIIQVVTLGVVALVGILIYAEIDSALGTPDNSALADAQENVTGGFESAMQLVPVVLIVLIAAVVIGIVSRLR